MKIFFFFMILNCSNMTENQFSIPNYVFSNNATRNYKHKRNHTFLIVPLVCDTYEILKSSSPSTISADKLSGGVSSFNSKIKNSHIELLDDLDLVSNTDIDVGSKPIHDSEQYFQGDNDIIEHSQENVGNISTDEDKDNDVTGANVYDEVAKELCGRKFSPEIENFFDMIACELQSDSSKIVQTSETPYEDFSKDGNESLVVDAENVQSEQTVKEKSMETNEKKDGSSMLQEDLDILRGLEDESGHIDFDNLGFDDLLQDIELGSDILNINSLDSDKDRKPIQFTHDVDVEKTLDDITRQYSTRIDLLKSKNNLASISTSYNSTVARKRKASSEKISEGSLNLLREANVCDRLSPEPVNDKRFKTSEVTYHNTTQFTQIEHLDCQNSTLQTDDYCGHEIFTDYFIKITLKSCILDKMAADKKTIILQHKEITMLANKSLKCWKKVNIGLLIILRNFFFIAKTPVNFRMHFYNVETIHSADLLMQQVIDKLKTNHLNFILSGEASIKTSVVLYNIEMSKVCCFNGINLKTIRLAVQPHNAGDLLISFIYIFKKFNLIRSQTLILFLLYHYPCNPNMKDFEDVTLRYKTLLGKLHALFHAAYKKTNTCDHESVKAMLESQILLFQCQFLVKRNPYTYKNRIMNWMSEIRAHFPKRFSPSCYVLLYNIFGEAHGAKEFIHLQKRSLKNDFQKLENKFILYFYVSMCKSIAKFVYFDEIIIKHQHFKISEEYNSLISFIIY